ncbi:hypothetical protein EUTSA_v10010364mg [Eutrema salsugineum]|uniref:F-box domain-containing protein n=1 Tax=Eutrema salsugineum TaxID=72664 RepID=V4LPD5_EUTSA|nr:FBD-associated F-box protein At3g49020 [Eutrema salsugineum]ESQ45639.1 hypothetical protein EUTSA_v10010364mg [Eutrema salsugineum]
MTEHKCKIDGECLDVVKEDRISELPDDLLLLILSPLQTETVIATSVLSKRWRSLWKMVPKLKFDSKYHKSERFSENVLRSLLSHKAPVLESLHLVVRDTISEDAHVERWFEISDAQHARKLVVDLHNDQYLYSGFPCVFFSSNDTLHTLKLKNNILLDFPSGVCLKSLRKLHLEYVVYNNEESVRKLFLGCPNLEDLLLKRGSNALEETFTITVPRLQRLTIEGDHNSQDPGYMINAPSLKYLSISKTSHLECCLIENAPGLVEAKIIDVSYIKNENILVSLTAVKRLSLDLSPFEIKYPTGIIFHQLVYLELFTQNGWNLLSLMLDSCPQLQILKLINPYRFAKRKNRPVRWEWSKRTCVPECLLYHLETFVWTRYQWQREDEKEVATYILKNARRLKKATISTRPIQTKELKTLKNIKMLEKRRGKMLDQLANEVRASNSCHLVFECDTFSCK